MENQQIQYTNKTWTPKFIALVAGLLVVGGIAFVAIWQWQNKIDNQPVPTFSMRVIPPPKGTETYHYNNDQYGFLINLANGWAGFIVMDSQWEGRDVATGKVTEHGPIITLRHPLWTQANPREDMPVMIFTPAQWALVQQEKMSLGAAPIPPSLLGQNSKYIMALPARYNYDYKTGWEEVDQLVHTLKAFELVQ